MPVKVEKYPYFMLTGADIDQYLHNRIPNTFKGVYSRDAIPNGILQKNKDCIVVNLDDKRNDGTHWVSLSKKGNKYYYFDPFGQKPPEEILNKYEPLFYNSKIYQNVNDATCGYWVIAHLIGKI